VNGKAIEILAAAGIGVSLGITIITLIIAAFSIARRRKVERPQRSCQLYILGPFRLPAPDDPRWAGAVENTRVIYTLGCLRCTVSGFQWSWTGCPYGFLYVDGLRIIEAECNINSGDEDRYVRAVHEAYQRAHPELDMEPPRRPIVQDRIVAALERANRGGAEAEPEPAIGGEPGRKP
jgi:hypothetical protein